jgi:hypothetical protein
VAHPTLVEIDRLSTHGPARGHLIVAKYFERPLEPVHNVVRCSPTARKLYVRRAVVTDQ